MYLRWKLQHRQQCVTRAAVLVESRRVSGQPRQRTVAYLGALQDGLIQDEHYGYHVREQFWGSLLPRLDRLSLEPTERERIIAKIAAVAPQVTDAEREEHRRREAESNARFNAELARIRAEVRAEFNSHP